MAVLVLAQHDGKSLEKPTLHAVAAAQKLGEVHLLVAGSGTGAIAEAATKAPGVPRVLHAVDPAFAQPAAQTVAELLLALAGPYAAVLAASTAFARNVLPRVAA